MPMTIFLSYAHQDAPKIDVLSRDLDDLVGAVWLDKSLSGGQLWWDEILRQIRECRLFVLAVSRHSLRSEACLAESAYATALDRPFLSVRVDDADLVAAPAAIRQRQLIDFLTEDVPSIKALARALMHAPAPGPLPARPAAAAADPLVVPRSVRHAVRPGHVDGGSGRHVRPAQAGHRQRRQRGRGLGPAAHPARPAGRVVEGARGDRRVPRRARRAAPARPGRRGACRAGGRGDAARRPPRAGWYADPTGRFEMRYWDGTRWTEHVGRGGQQFRDPPGRT